jgi:Domain of unknown function (DUF4160)
MATVAMVDGIKIQFYNDEHPPPHFHAEYAEYQAMIRIDTLKVIEGRMPRPQLRKIVAWAKPRRSLLREAWATCRRDGNPGKIP